MGDEGGVAEVGGRWFAGLGSGGEVSTLPESEGI